jgi:aminoglycoside phosphotransferase (APT) family kinase protein
MIVVALEPLRILGGESGAVTAFDRDGDSLSFDIDQIEALVLLSKPGRGRGSRLHNQRRAGAGNQIAGAVHGSHMVVPGKKQVNAGIADRVERQLAPSRRRSEPVADRKREKRVVGDENAGGIGVGTLEGLLDEVHLVVADPAARKGQRASGIDPQNRRSGDLVKWAERVVDVAHVAGQRRQEAPEHVVKRNVVIAGDGKHVMPGLAKLFEKSASLLELLGARPLREIAADDDDVWPGLVHPQFDCFDQLWVVSSEMQVGKVDQASHVRATRVTAAGSLVHRDAMDRTQANSGTKPVGDRLRFDEAALERWMQDNVPGFGGPIEVSQFKGGQSNPTYRIDSRNGAYVVRRKPPGMLLPGAHAVDREYRVLDALGRQGFPVARVHALCEDDSVIGTPFFVMDMVEGRIFWEAHLPGLSREDRGRAFDSMNATIARLHDFDPEMIGLGSFGRPGGFVERQVARWSKQYLGDVEAGRIEAMDRLVEWLGNNLPPDSGRSSVVHGDYRCDNMIFESDKPEVRAVLDWELSTLGDPASDFTYHLLMYRMPTDLFAGLSGMDLESLGIPSEEDYVAAYCRRTGREGLPNKDYLVVFNLFRLAAILHGIRGRIARGTASSPHAVETASKLEPLAELTWEQAETACL